MIFRESLENLRSRGQWYTRNFEKSEQVATSWSNCFLFSWGGKSIVGERRVDRSLCKDLSIAVFSGINRGWEGREDNCVVIVI